MSVSIARKIAFDVLLRVTAQGAYADEALRGSLAKIKSSEDAGLATELTFGVLRWQRLLDTLVDRHLTKSNKTLDAEVRIALRLGAYQLLFLQRIPDHAAVNETVELVKLARKRSAAPLVNAILRKVAAQSTPTFSPVMSVATLLPRDLPRAELMSIQYSHPTWLVEKWLLAFGEKRTEALLAANNRVPALSGYIADPAHEKDTLSSLQLSGCTVRPGRLLRDALLLEGGNPSDGEIVRRGWLAIQDEASQAVAHLVAVEPGNTVLDLCAAPGGKTIRLSLDAGPKGHVIAVDLHPHRVRAMTERFERAGLRNIETRILDATAPLPFEQKFDRILVDVPCSGTGTLSRHPEIRWKIQPEDLINLRSRQSTLLMNALPHLAPGGQLVYSTCSLEPEENESVVNEVLGILKNSFRVLSARDFISKFLQKPADVESVVGGDGFFRTFPSDHGADGFFSAIIVPG